MILGIGRERTIEETTFGLLDDNEPSRIKWMVDEVSKDNEHRCVKCDRRVPHGVYRQAIDRYFLLGRQVLKRRQWVQFYCVNCLHEIDPMEYPYTVEIPNKDDLNTADERQRWY